ncbi:DNA polymerase [Gordonia sp. (in: high G+C Gram-positive bacteria)]|uniref:DNA polymerase n=1 Tax=Gordonia sp. (in: high G+C Gram-positive bacteria) TaxID=84139 RepID=UPI00391CEBDC
MIDKPTPTITFVPVGDDPTPALDALVPTVRRFLAVDVETNALRLSDPRYAVKTVQLGSPSAAVILSADDAVHRAAARRMMVEEAGTRGWFLTAHNASFDTQALVKIGVFSDLDEAWSRMVDTLVLASMIEPPMLGNDAPPSARAYRGLKHQAATWCPSTARSEDAKSALKKLFTSKKWKGLATTFDVYKTPIEQNGWAQVDPADATMIEYAADDVIDGAQLAETLYPIVFSAQPSTAQREHRIARLCAGMEMRGMRLDREYTQQRLDEVTEESRTAEEKLAELGLVNPSRGLGEWLVSKGVQVQYGKSRTLKNGTVKRTVLTEGTLLAQYAQQDADVAAAVPLLEQWRLAGKLASTYFGRYLAQPADRLHPDIKTAEAATGRMSIANPSIQNAPRKGGVRECFIADEGKVLVTADFSSVEMRVAGALAQDRALYDVFASGDDPYWVVARQLHGSGASKDQRDSCKAVALGRLYGQGIAGLSRTHGIPEDTARTITEAFDNAYPDLGKLRYRIEDKLLAHGVPCWTNALGRHQRLDPTMKYKAVNYLAQGLSRDVLAEAMCRAEDAGLGHLLWVPIHDEIVVQAPEDQSEEYKNKLVEIMSTTLLGWTIPAEGIVLGKRWRKA